MHSLNVYDLLLWSFHSFSFNAWFLLSFINIYHSVHIHISWFMLSTLIHRSWNMVKDIVSTYIEKDFLYGQSIGNISHQGKTALKLQAWISPNCPKYVVPIQGFSKQNTHLCCGYGCMDDMFMKLGSLTNKLVIHMFTI